MGIEENGYQVVLAQETEDYTDIPVHRHKTMNTNKQDDLIGLPRKVSDWKYFPLVTILFHEEEKKQVKLDD